jgi:hypothetical protein
VQQIVAAVGAGTVPTARLDDAVEQVLAVKGGSLCSTPAG